MQSNGNGIQGMGMSSTGIRIRVSDLLFAFQKRWPIIVALSFVGLVFGLILSGMTYVQSSLQTFSIKGSFAVTTQNANGLYIGNATDPNNNDYHLAEDMIDGALYVIRSNRVMSEVINDQQLLNYTVADMRGGLSVGQYNTTQILEMTLTWRDAEEGLQIWNAIVRIASKLLPETLQLGSLAIINEPEATLVGSGGGGKSIPVLLTMLGFGSGVGYAVIELLMHPTLNNVRDMENIFGLETIGVIPRDEAYYKRKGSLLSREDAGTSNVEQNFSAASYILRNRLGHREEHHCFYVTSAVMREGKTTVAANLAIQLADMEHRTLLIDFDTRNPNLGTLFFEKVDYAHSLNALYQGEANEDDAITTLTGYLDILPAVLEHNIISMDSSIIEMIEKLQQKYEYVIIDAPPVGMVSDTLSLNQVANTVLFVIGYDISSIPEIQSALEKLDKSGNKMGFALNQNAEERRKNIRQKSAKKREAQAAFGVSEETQAQPGRGKLGLKQKKKKEKEKTGKPGLFGRKKAQKTLPAPTQEQPAPLSQTVMPQRARNLFDDLDGSADGLERQSKTDKDTMEALLGIDMEEPKTDGFQQNAAADGDDLLDEMLSGRRKGPDAKE